MKKQKRKNKSDRDIAMYWDKTDATDVLDLDLKKSVDLSYQPAVQTISIRLPVLLIRHIKQIASGMDIAYQALIKVWLSQKSKEEQKNFMTNQMGRS